MAAKLNIVETPPWLLDPPTGLPVDPPVVTREQLLPLEKLGWKDFERLCLRLAKLTGEAEHWQLYGTEGQKQGGIDIYVRSPGSAAYRVWQAKRYKVVRATDLAKAVSVFLAGPWAGKSSHFIFCTSANMEATEVSDAVEVAATRLKAAGITLEIQDAVHLSALLKDHPTVVDDFFDRPWVEAFCGKNAAEALGDRLGRLDFSALRQRLAELYEAHFEAVDPGVLRATGGFGAPARALPLAQRFVPPDFQTTQTDTIIETEIAQDEELIDGEPLPGRNIARRARTVVSVPRSRRTPFESWGQNFEKAVVFGPPGAGKSTVLRFLALELLRETPRFPTLKQRWPNHLPLLLSFPFWTRRIQSAQPGAAMSVPSAVCAWLEANGAPDLAALAARAFTGRKVLLLVDGVDEWADEAAATAGLTLLQTFSQTHAVPTIVTSRPHGARLLGTLDATWERYKLASFDTGQQIEFAESWFTFLAEQLDEFAGNSQARAQAFVEDLHALPEVAMLAGTPLLLGGLLALAREGASLPRSRFEAYRELTDRLLTAQPKARARAALSGTAPVVLDPRSRERVLAALAFAIQSNRSAEAGLDAIDREQALWICKAAIMLHHDSDAGTANQQARGLLAVGAEAIGILVEKSPSTIGFLHRAFQELLAASHISGLPLNEQQAILRTHAQNPQWRDILLFVTQFAARSDDVAALVSAVESAANDLIGDSARILLLADITFSDVRRTPQLTRALAQRLFTIVENGADIDLRAEILQRVVHGLAADQTSLLVRPKLASWFPRYNPYNLAQTLDLVSDWQDEAVDDVLWRNLGSDEAASRTAAARGLAKRHAGSPAWREKVEALLRQPPTVEICASALTLLDLGWGDTPSARDRIDVAVMQSAAAIKAAAIQARIRAGRHSDTDRETVLGWLDGRDYRIQDEALQLIIAGWKGDPVVKAVVLRNLETKSAPDTALSIAAQAFPGDQDVANAIAANIRNQSYISNAPALFTALATSFPGNTVFIEAVLHPQGDPQSRDFSTFQRSNAARIAVTDELRDKLLEDLRNDRELRFWTVEALLDHWPNDENVREALKAVDTWKTSDLARVAESLKRIYPDDLPKVEGMLRAALKAAVTDRNVYLGNLVHALGDLKILESDPALVDAIVSLVQARNPDAASIDNTYVRLFEFCGRNPAVRTLALQSIRTPKGFIGVIALFFGDDPEVRRTVLDTAAPLPLELRIVLADALKDRAIDDPWARQLLEEGMLDAEAGLAALCTLRGARARLASGTSDDAYTRRLEGEMQALGPHFESRRIAGFVSLATVGRLERALELAQQQHSPKLRLNSWDLRGWIDFNALVADVWMRVVPELEAAGLTDLLEISDDDIVERFAPFVDGRRQLEALVGAAIGRGFARGRVSPAMLRARLRDPANRPDILDRAVPLLADGESWIDIARTLDIADLVSRNFAGNAAAHDAIAAQLEKGYLSGPIAALCDGWPKSPVVDDIRSNLERDETHYGTLLTPVALKLIATISPVDAVMRNLDNMIEHLDGTIWDGIPYWRSTMRRRVQEDSALRSAMFARLRAEPTAGETVTYASYLSAALGMSKDLAALCRARLARELSEPVARSGMDLWVGGQVLVWKRLAVLLRLSGNGE